MRRYVQLAMRRNGLHAVRGWCLNQLGLCPGTTMDRSGYELEGQSWFSWTIKHYRIDEVVDAAGSEPFVTLESFPYNLAVKVAKHCGATIVFHVRSFENWLASSIQIERARDGSISEPMLEECIRTWVDYTHQFKSLTPVGQVRFLYDEWVASTPVRRAVASRLGVDAYDGSPYQRVHGIEYSSFDGSTYDGRASEMDTLCRYKRLKSDPLFQRFVKFKTQVEAGR